MKRMVLGFAMAALAVAACTDQAADVGTVGVALTSTDAGGTQYRLPAGSRLQMSGGTYFDELSLDGDASFLKLDVPVGDYAAELVNDAGYTTSWPLQRRAPDGTISTVDAVLTTTMPAPITIGEGTMTNLVLRFTVPDAGTVVFAHGAVGVTIDVGTSAASRIDVAMQGTLNVGTIVSDPSAPPVLATRMPVAGTTGLALSIGGHVVGPWTQSSASTACATLDMTTHGSSQAGIADLLGEATNVGAAVPAFAQLCVYGGPGVPPQAEIFTYRIFTGTATTPTFADLGSHDWQFLSYLTIDLPVQAFDGTTLNLDALRGLGPVPASGLSRAQVRITPGQPRVNWFRTVWSGTVDLSLVLTP
jgi:hypothetical protein